jgi:hypothetical protein
MAYTFARGAHHLCEHRVFCRFCPLATKYMLFLQKFFEASLSKSAALLQSFTNRVTRSADVNWPLRQNRKEPFVDMFQEQNMSSKCRNLLLGQLKMSKQAWEALQNKGGATVDDEFCLNFKFTAPNHACSEALKDSIRRKTDYTVQTASEGRYIKNWVVQGATKPVKISQEVIYQWVSGMVKLGLQYDCKFSGWWLWKYDDFACPGVPPVKQTFGSFVQDKPGLIRQLAQLMKK